MDFDRRSIRRVTRWWGVVLLVFAFGVSPVPVMGQDQVEPQAARYVLRLYPGPCSALTLEQSMLAESGPPQAVPAPPFEAHVFTLEIEGALPGSGEDPLAVAIASVEGDLLVTVACGDLAPGAAGEAVVSLLSPVSGELVGVAVVREEPPGRLVFEAYLMLPDTGDGDAPVNPTVQPDPDAEPDDGEDEDDVGGV